MNNQATIKRTMRRLFREVEIDMIRDINRQMWGSGYTDTRYQEERLFLARDWKELGPIFPRVAAWERRWRIARRRARQVVDRVRYR